MPDDLPHPGLTVKAALDRWPAVIPVFIRRRMACVGCAVAPFMTLAEAAESYGIPPAALIADLRRAIARAAASAKPRTRKTRLTRRASVP
jgi:hybrid cluster-associated redox disulfide protein